jgi:DNA-binding FadR family transcriptional regulator
MSAKQKLSEQVREKLRQEMLNGKYKSGDRLPPEAELMQLFNVGRSTIREAIRDLVLAGMLRVQQGAGTTVIENPESEPLDSRLRRADFDDINAVRKLLEKEIVSLAAQNRSADDLKKMNNWLDKRRAAIGNEDRTACMDADIGFHLAMASASGNTVLADLYESFTNIIRGFFNSREPAGLSRFALSHHLHQTLLRAIENNDPLNAQEVLQQIIDNNY